MALNIVDHPLARHLLALLRNVGTPPEQFRTVCKNLTTLVVLEATRNLPSASSRVTTPLAETEAQLLARPLAIIPVLRAGLGMLDPVTQMFPDVAVGYIGLERHETTGVAHSYYCKLPDLKGKDVLCLDPMLATGGSAAQALALIKAQSPASVAMVSIIAAPEGARRLEREHPDVEAFVAVLDDGLDTRMFIVPGLGDFGDRLYGTS